MNILGASILALAVLQVYCTPITFEEVVDAEWKEYKTLHGKKYATNVEETLRRKIYMENKAKIARHNSRANNGSEQFFMKMNHFGDLLNHEFVNMVNGFDHASYLRSRNENSTYAAIRRSFVGTFLPPASVTEYPSEIDWRQKGAVTPVKNQGQCGSCWSFSATGALEGQNYRKTGKLVSLSEQNLIDCSVSYGNHGCGGGLMDNAYKYIKENRGIDTEESYPYEAMNDDCRYKASDKGATDIGFTDIESENEELLQKAVATVGPVSVAIDASQQSFQFYSHGVYYDEHCNQEQLDHGVLVVGYGTLHNEDYWLVKNSWGPKWGLSGYIRMARNRNNNCGIASAASYPNV